MSIEIVKTNLVHVGQARALCGAEGQMTLKPYVSPEAVKKFAKKNGYDVCAECLKEHKKTYGKVVEIKDEPERSTREDEALW